MRILRPTHIYHLSETASYQRVNALKLIESVPEAQEALFNGEVSLSNAALVQSFIQRSEKEAKEPLSSEEKMTIIKSIKGKTHREAQVTLAEVNPIAALPANKEKPLSNIVKLPNKVRVNFILAIFRKKLNAQSMQGPMVNANL